MINMKTVAPGSTRRRAESHRFLPAGPLDQSTVRVSVVMPLLNEASHIDSIIRSVLAQSFDSARVEIVAVVGPSRDGTRERLMWWQTKCDRLRIVDNPKSATPVSLNLGIAAAEGDVIVRVDGHCQLASNYIEQCVRLLSESQAANVGGLMRATADSRMGQAIARGTRSRFGIGNARFHYLEREEFVDTVYLGAFRREVLIAMGGYDEELIRNQDDELNYRIRRAGYGVLLSPEIMSSYFPRVSLAALWHQYFDYGMWKIRVIEKHPGSLQVRHLAPATLVTTLALTTLSFLRHKRIWLLSPWGVYVAGVLAATAVETRSAPKLALHLALVFPTLHMSYGFGFLFGIMNLLKRNLERFSCGG